MTVAFHPRSLIPSKDAVPLVPDFSDLQRQFGEATRANCAVRPTVATLHVTVTKFSRPTTYKARVDNVCWIGLDGTY